MAKVTAAQWLDKWGTRLNAAGPYIKSGVQNVKTAPGVKAAAAQDLMLTNLTHAITSGLWAKRVSSVSLTDWQNAIINKGIPRIAQGVTAAQASKNPIITALLSAVDAAAGEANALPRGGLEQNIQRAVTFMRSMAQKAPKKQI